MLHSKFKKRPFLTWKIKNVKCYKHYHDSNEIASVGPKHLQKKSKCQNPMKGGVGFYWKKSSIPPPPVTVFFF